MKNTLAKLRVLVVYRKFRFFFWQSKIERVAIVCSLSCPVPNLARPIKSVMEYDPFKGWMVTKELSQFNRETKNVKEFTLDVDRGDESFIGAFMETLGGTHFDGCRLSPARAIARLCGFHGWKYATYKTLGFLKDMD